jgi:heat shock protein HslJ
MKKNIASISFLVLFAVACNSAKNNTSMKSDSYKTSLIEGTWEVNYIMNAPKPVEVLFLKAKPVITFTVNKNTISGNSGCNNFNGEFTIDDNKIIVADALATTRKMCPDMTGEQLFLETLKKINTYSVTNQGKTLNLIMGDIAVMRFTKKQIQNEK